jgi:hypothetical protein
MGIPIRKNSSEGGTVRGDSWFDALAKLIPGELIVAYAGALHVEGVANSRTAHLTILVAFTCLSPLVLAWSGKRAHTRPDWLQYVVRTIAFVLYALGSDADLVRWLAMPSWIPGVGAFVIALLAAFVLAPPGAD